MYISAKETFQTYYPDECEAKNCKQHADEEKALLLAEQGDHVTAVNSLCGKRSNIAVPFGKWEVKKGIIYGETFRRILILLRVCGVVHLQSIFDVDEVLQPIANVHGEDFDAWAEKAAEKNADFASTNVEWANVASRGSSRFETRLPMKAPFIDPRFAGNRLLVNAIKAVLGGKIELDTFSAVTSMPNSPNQFWHSDVADLFANEGRAHTPAHGLVAVVPFVDLTSTTGATEYYMGSYG
eukprot:gene13725-4575_t